MAVKKSKKIKKSKKVKSSKQSNWAKELKDRMPVLKYIGGFIIFTIIFYILTDADWFETIRRPIIAVYSGLSSIFLNILGYGTSADGSLLTSSQFSVNIKEGCDAIIPTILYAVAILVFPTDWSKKWRGLLAGVAFLFALNLIRIISLFLTGIYAPSIFEFMHVEFWQALFILITIMIFLRWLKSTTLTPLPTTTD